MLTCLDLIEKSPGKGKFYQRLGINFDENEQKTEAVEVDSPAQIVIEQKEEEETEQEETKRK